MQVEDDDLDDDTLGIVINIDSRGNCGDECDTDCDVDCAHCDDDSVADITFFRTKLLHVLRWDICGTRKRSEWYKYHAFRDLLQVLFPLPDGSYIV